MTTCDSQIPNFSLSSKSNALEASEARLKQVETELQATREQLARSQKSFHSFLNLVSHDLNAPLRSIVGFAGFLDEEYSTALDDDGRNYLQRITDAGKKLQGQLLGLKLIARVESRGEPFKPVDLNDVIAEAQLSLARRLKASQGRITSDRLPTVHADANQISVLLEAILENSLQHGEQDQPEIHVSAVEAGGHCLISIRDNGVGVDSEFRERIFDAFFRIKPASSQGSGCGLTICRAIVERHGGRISLHSDPANVMEIVFSLPLANTIPAGNDDFHGCIPQGSSSAGGETR